MSRRRKGGGEGGQESSERWLLTYADMITLLLALFILLYAMSTIDVVKFDAIKTSLSHTFNGQVFNADKDIVNGSAGVLDPTASADNPSDTLQIRVDATNKVNARWSRDASDVRKLVSKEHLDGAQGVTVTTTERGIVIRLAGDSLFATGSSTITPRFQHLLERLAPQLKADGLPMAIEGHTDGQPLGSGGMYPSNWSLSSARALAVLDSLHTGGVPTSRLQAGFFADTKPLVKPAYPTQAVAANRRVEIVLLSPGSSSRVAPGEDGKVTSNVLPAPSARGDAAASSDGPDLRPLSASHPVVSSIISTAGGVG